MKIRYYSGTAAVFRMAVLLLSCGIVSRAQTVQTSRPRLLLSPNMKSELLAKMKGSGEDRKLWSDFRTYTDTYLKSNALSLGVNAALIYQLDPSTNLRYGQHACSIAVDAIVQPKGILSGAAWKSGNQNRWYTPQVAYIYDWAHDACTEQQLHSMAEFFKGVYAFWSAQYAVPYTKIANNIFAGAVRTNLMMAIALSGDDPAVDSWVAASMTLFRKAIKPCFNNTTAMPVLETGAGGSWPEGIEYAPETKAIYWEYLQIASIALHTDLFAEVPSFAIDSLNFAIENTSPTGTTNPAQNKIFEPYPLRDVQHLGTLWITDRALMVRLQYHFRARGDRRNAGRAQWWLKRIQPYYNLTYTVNTGDAFGEFLFAKPSDPAVDYRTDMRPDHLTPFMLLSRSDWTENATWVGFHAMQEAFDHTHGDSGQFQIYRKGQWLTREVPGYQRGGNQLATGYVHNQAMLNFHSSFGAMGRLGQPEGWGRFSRTANGYMAECAADESYCYAQADLSEVYRFKGYAITPDVDTGGFLRDVLYLKPDFVIVADRYHYANGLEAPSISMIQALERPVVNGSAATLTSKKQALHLHVVAPSKPNIQVRRLDRMGVMGARKIDDQNVDIFVDGQYLYGNWPQVTISGATGLWAPLNGTWTAGKYAVETAYNAEKVHISGSSGAFAGIPNGAQWDFTQSVLTDKKRDFDSYRVDITSGKYLNRESQLLVLEVTDGGAAATSVRDCSSTTVNAAQFSRYAVAAIKGPAGGTIEYHYSPGTQPITHYILDLKPGATYGVDSSRDGEVIITPAPAANARTVQATDAGVLIFQTSPRQ